MSHNRSHLASLFPLLATAFIFAGTPASSKAETDFGQVSMHVANMLQNHHYSRFDFDDALSERLLDNYFTSLDYTKRFFTQEDVDRFTAKYATTLDDEILMRGGLVTQGYYKNEEATAETFDADGWLHTGDLGRIDEHGYLTIIGRKKEIIINAAGKNIAPAKLENLVKQSPLIDQACVVGDGRRYITLVLSIDPEAAAGWAAKQGIEYTDLNAFADHEAVQTEIERIVEEANSHVARVEQAKKWFVAGDEWSPESGELTPSLKLKRRVVLERYEPQIEAMYTD